MTDIVTEFINVSNLKYEDLLAGVTIVSNSGTECAVLKDVVISNPSGRALSLEVGDAVVAATATDAKLAGSELLGRNTKLELKTRSVPTLNEIYSAEYLPSLVKRLRIPTLFDGNVDRFEIIPSVNQVVNKFEPSTITFMCFDSAGNFYYASHGAAKLYKRTGGINGEQSSYSFGSMCFVFDGVRYIHSFSGNFITSFDVVSSTVTSKACAISPVASQSYASALDGWVYVRASYSNEVNYLVNPISGNTVAAPGLANEFGYGYYVGLGKDSNGNYICWQTNYYNSINWWNIGPNLSNPVVRQAGLIPLGFVGNSVVTNGVVQASRQVGSSSIFYVAGNSGLFQFDVNSKLVRQFSAGDRDNISNGPSFVSAVKDDFVSADFGVVGIRATGIKTKY